MYLVQLADSVVTAANVKHHGAIVKEKAILRALLRQATEVAASVYEEKGIEEILPLLAAPDIMHESGIVSIKQVADESWEQIKIRRANMGKLSGFSTGFKSLDDAIDGIQLGELTIVGGSSRMGKTALVNIIAMKIAQAVPVHQINLEMTNHALFKRQLSIEASVPAWKLKRGYLNGLEMDALKTGCDALAKYRMTFEESPLNKLDSIMMACVRAVRQGAKVIVIDNLSLVDNDTSKQNHAVNVGNITKALKSFSRRNNVAIILLVQINRSAHTRENKRPTMNDLRDSGQIENDADVVMLLYREDYYRADPSQRDGTAELILGKTRNDEEKTLPLRWDGLLTRYYEPITTDTEEPF
jgi:replicative DNA helicase